MALNYKTIKPLLLTGSNVSSRAFSYIGLTVGILLLLCSIQMFINIQQLLKKNDIRKNGFEYISISKLVTNENMGKDNRFTNADLNELRAQPFIDGAAPLLPNEFKVVAGAGSMIPFSSDIFIEAIDNDFIDTVPPTFKWQEGQQSIPVIFSSDMLEMYNVFAPSYDLPQMSPATAANVNLSLRCEGALGEMSFQANIVAFSDRVSSVLVPENFLAWANKKFEGIDSVRGSRVFIKTKDANDENLLRFLDEKGYRVNKERAALGRSRTLLQGIISGLGLFGLLVVLLALMLFSFYLQLVVARSKDNLQLLITLGYSPSWLGKNLAKRFVPVYITVVLIALLTTQLIQWSFHHFVMYDRPELSSFIHPAVLIIAAFLAVASIIANYAMIKKLLNRIA